MITSVSVIPQDTGVSLSSSCFPWRLCRKMNKAEMQKSVATLETETASCMAWERRANILLSIRSPKLLHRDRKLLLQHREHPLELWGCSGCCCWPQRVVLPLKQGQNILWLFCLKQGVEEWGVPGDALSTQGPSWVPGALLCHAGMVAWVGLVLLVLRGLTWATETQMLLFAPEGPHCSSSTALTHSALGLMALLPGKMKYRVGQ